MVVDPTHGRAIWSVVGPTDRRGYPRGVTGTKHEQVLEQDEIEEDEADK
uniref:Uncharacterized protein n=1 Tax=Solanum tuberosum TaxID=4113 RepID=M1DYW2_SOLTU